MIVVRTFSKIHGHAGLRVGYSASSAERSRSLSSSRLQWGINVVAAQTPTAALDDPDYVRLSAKRNTDDRQEFYNQANARMLRSVDSRTNFVLLKTELPAPQVLDGLCEEPLMHHEENMKSALEAVVG
jgi:histidinol-phosphate aminotransferase